MNEPHKLGTVSALLAVLCLSLSACGSQETGKSTNAASPRTNLSSRSKSRTRPERNRSEGSSSSSGIDDGDELTTEDDFDEGPEQGKRSFHGYRCISDCSGHEAGYKWAEAHDIDDVDRCGGNSQSFIEGCQAWVEENY